MAQGVVRKLAAVLCADAVGFTARVAADETGALRAVKASPDIAEQVIGLHAGRVVKTMGDGLLAEFGSVVAAVSAAATIQSHLAARQRDVPKEAHFDFRIGVHVGDVVVDGDDILGAGGDKVALDRARTELMSRFPEASTTRIRQCFAQMRNYSLQRDALEARMRAAGLPD